MAPRGAPMVLGNLLNCVLILNNLAVYLTGRKHSFECFDNGGVRVTRFEAGGAGRGKNDRAFIVDSELALFYVVADRRFAHYGGEHAFTCRLAFCKAGQFEYRLRVGMERGARYRTAEPGGEFVADGAGGFRFAFSGERLFRRGFAFGFRLGGNGGFYGLDFGLYLHGVPLVWVIRFGVIAWAGFHIIKNRPACKRIFSASDPDDKRSLSHVVGVPVGLGIGWRYRPGAGR